MCASLCYILLVDFFVIREVEDFTVLFLGCFHVFFFQTWFLCHF